MLENEIDLALAQYRRAQFALEPENLACDGEATQDEVFARREQAQDDLYAISMRLSTLFGRLASALSPLR